MALRDPSAAPLFKAVCAVILLAGLRVRGVSTIECLVRDPRACRPCLLERSSRKAFRGEHAAPGPRPWHRRLCRLASSSRKLAPPLSSSPLIRSAPPVNPTAPTGRVRRRAKLRRLQGPAAPPSPTPAAAASLPSHQRRAAEQPPTWLRCWLTWLTSLPMAPPGKTLRGPSCRAGVQPTCSSSARHVPARCACTSAMD